MTNEHDFGASQRPKCEVPNGFLIWNDEKAETSRALTAINTDYVFEVLFYDLHHRR